MESIVAPFLRVGDFSTPAHIGSGRGFCEQPPTFFRKLFVGLVSKAISLRS